MNYSPFRRPWPVKDQMTVTMTGKVVDKTITVSLYDEALRERVRWEADKLIREGLIKLGWTPPPEKPA